MTRTFEIWIRHEDDKGFEASGEIFNTLADAVEFGEEEVGVPWQVVSTHYETDGTWDRIIHRSRTLIPGSPQNNIHIQDVNF